MDVLIVLTLIYAAVLVVALAASLIAILVYLRRIGTALGEAREALTAVSAATAPLEEHLQSLHDASASSAQELAQTQAQLENANDQLTGIVERLGAGERIQQKSGGGADV